LIYKVLPEGSGSRVKGGLPLGSDKSDRAEKSFDKLMRQNTKIAEKIELIITSQKSLENRLSKIEKLLDNKSNELDDKTVRMVIISIK
jgi:hypothetical protein